MHCPQCGSEEYTRYGRTHHGKQRFKCKACGRQYIEGSQYQHISQETWELIDKLLLEKIPLAGIVRVTGISESHLQNYVNRKFDRVS